MKFIGIDPGISGAIVCIDDFGKYIDHIKGSDTPHEIATFLRRHHDATFAFIEKVHAGGTGTGTGKRKMGASSAFTFGKSTGIEIGILVYSLIPYEEVSPSKWMQFMKCRTGGNKNITKAAAQKLFPKIKITHVIADALLIAEYCRRTYNERIPQRTDPF